MNTAPRVLVMMATYNGAQYLKQQIDSILSQEQVAITLRIRDDGSSDDTCRIAQGYASEYSNVLFSRNEENEGVARNFMHMVYEDDQHVNGPYDYYAFADQDDIWRPRKLARAIEMLRPPCASARDTRDGFAESTASSKRPGEGVGASGPALYYSDATNFDDEREWSELADYRPVLRYPTTLLLRNWASGCTMVFNRELRDLLCAHKLDTFPRIHDVWVHLVALAKGSVYADFDTSLIRRRITGHNVVGDLSDHHTSVAQAGKDLGNLRHESDHAPSRVAQQLLDEFGDDMDPSLQESAQMLACYRRSLRTRILAASRFRFWQPSRRGRLIVRLCFLLGRY